MKSLTPRLALVMTLVAALAAPAAAEAQRSEQTERFTRTFKVGADGQVVLSNIAGDISVTAGATNEVTIEVVKRARARSDADAKEQLALVEVEVTETAGRIEARTRYPRTENRSINVSVSYTVTAPATVRVEARSISGDLRISGIKGAVGAESTSGEVVIENGERVDRKSVV